MAQQHITNEAFMGTVDINLVLLLLIILIPILFFLRKNQKTVSKTVSIIILDQIKEINEFASHELTYFENISNQETLELFHKFKIPFIKKGFSLNLIGKIKIGINLENVKVEKLNNNINITIPEIIIISHETKISEIGFQTKNPIFQNDFNDLNKSLEEKKIFKEKEILNNNDLIKEAYEELKKRITDSLLINPKISKKLNINFETDTPSLVIEDK